MIVIGHACDRGTVMIGDIVLGNFEYLSQFATVPGVFRIEIEHQPACIECQHQFARRVRLTGDT
jgi:hypothetical protein